MGSEFLVFLLIVGYLIALVLLVIEFLVKNKSKNFYFKLFTWAFGLFILFQLPILFSNPSLCKLWSSKSILAFLALILFVLGIWSFNVRILIGSPKKNTFRSSPLVKYFFVSLIVVVSSISLWMLSNSDSQEDKIPSNPFYEGPGSM